ncbi:MAG: hypothetical protein P1V97_30550 [Planctomycetota bacterium]|nr:hypothetical protein [Planctomycetota bacterium]
MCRSKKVNYSVVQGGGPSGDASSGIPRAFLFDWTGKCVAEGHPSKLYGKVDELMAKAPNWITGGREFKDSAVAGLAKKLDSNKDFGKIMVGLDKLGDNEEAAFLKERILKHGTSLWNQAKENETENAYQSQRQYKSLSKLFKGHDLGDKSAKRLKELKKDKDFQKELKAAKLLTAMENAMGQYKSNVKPAHPANRKPINMMRAILSKMRKKYPETNAYKKALEIWNALGV